MPKLKEILRQEHDPTTWPLADATKPSTGNLHRLARTMSSIYRKLADDIDRVVEHAHVNGESINISILNEMVKRSYYFDKDD